MTRTIIAADSSWFVDVDDESIDRLLATDVVVEEHLPELIDALIKLKPPDASITDAIENFILLIERKAFARLDYFGLPPGAIKNHAEALLHSDYEMTNQAAFNKAVMKEIAKAIIIKGLDEIFMDRDG